MKPRISDPLSNCWKLFGRYKQRGKRTERERESERESVKDSEGERAWRDGERAQDGDQLAVSYLRST